ncbi:hypothetical protein H4R18_005799 [Coemansia javaensis]|uniref:Uncharacterized protein n=1 Tax=Coemansia javaensis TaxID=2761396 RepID=A0A9W8H7G1_9FUNG|nr:hypothetical protein H4R18_005799 [Coemansia javaensis]
MYAPADGAGVFDAAQPSYTDGRQLALGCPHYQVNARVLAPCCGVWTPCRFCHNAAFDHAMDRFAVEQMKCMLCREEQPIGQQCRGCGAAMGRHYCAACRLIDNGPGKEIFHCDRCGICLSGRRSDYYHCAGCDACVSVASREKHGCRERILHADCPICGEEFFDSAHAIVQAPCTHLMHEQCLEESVKHSHRCPLCAMSLCDTRAMSAAIDSYLRASMMPPEHRGRLSNVFCNDCRRRSVAQFHFVYHKCGHCSSYNTTVLSESRQAVPKEIAMYKEDRERLTTAIGILGTLIAIFYRAECYWEYPTPRRNELLTTKHWINDLKSQYLAHLKDNAADLPEGLAEFPGSIHSYIDHYSAAYAANHDALVAYRARELFAESMRGAAFLPSANELKKLEASVVEEERLLGQVQQRLAEKVAEATARIEAQSQEYEAALELARANEELAAGVGELEAELAALGRAVDEKERRERGAVEQQTRELQAAHNDLVREAALRDEAERERARLGERLARLRSDEQKRRLSAEDSQEQQRLVERWVRAVAPVVGARVEGSTLVVTLGDGVGAMSGRRILAQFNDLGKIEAVRTDDGRELPPQLSHDALMRLLAD